MGPTNNRIGTLLSEINVVPLVDVVLVLLIIFMITAPMLQMGVDVELPKARAKVIPAEEQRVFVTLTKDGKLYINRYPVDVRHLKARLKEILDRRVRREVFFKADRSLSYGQVMGVMGELREAGVDRLGLVTEPQEVVKP